MTELEKISAEYHVNHNEFADFIVFKLYCYFLPNSIPKWLSKIFKKVEDEKIKNVICFFIE